MIHEVPEAQELVLSYMEGLNCPRALTVAILLRAGEWDQLTSLEVDPLHHLTPDSFRRSILATDLLRKLDGLPTGRDLPAITLDKWWWAERECFKTNRLLNEFLDLGTLRGVPASESFRAFVARVRQNIQLVIGDGPPTTWEGRFGPGATVSDSSRACIVPDKMSSAPTFTPNSMFHLVPWTGTLWARASAELGRLPRSCRGNVYFTVPKDSRSLRACAKEPSINGFYQLGLGRVLRDRLNRVGIDLVNGQELHRRVARDASVKGHMATIDLKSASDCVSTALVKLLLPPRWVTALESLRSPLTNVDGRWVHLEKFSSMGNGFTFELETILFYGIARTLVPSQTSWSDLKRVNSRGEGDVYVYGDDIIVPSAYASDVVSALTFFGFTPNPRKTFLEGSFRESCGGDFFLGEPVRAHYLEEFPDEPQKFISLANGIRRAASQDASGRLLVDVRRSWFRCLDSIPGQIRRCRGPEALGDIVIHDDETRWDARWRGQVRYLRAYRPLMHGDVRWGGYSYSVQLASAIYGVATQAGRDGRIYEFTRLPSRQSLVSYKVGWTPCS